MRAWLWRLRFVVAALCVGAAAGVVVQAQRPPAPATVPVVVLARDVTAGTALTADDLAVVERLPRDVPAGSLTRPHEAVDRVTAVDLPALLPLAPSLLTDGTLTGPPGTVVVAVRLDDPALAGMLTPGSRLDLVAARPEGGPGETVAHRALVRPSPTLDAAPGGLLGGTEETVAPVLVAVDPLEAVRIAEASVSSRLVAVVVR